jgi:hypothetical protein
MRKTLDLICSLPVLLLVAAAGTAVQAQSAGDSASPQDSAATQPGQARYWLRVTAQRVNLRSRADLNSRIVGRVSRDDALEARGAENGWHRIRPPAGVFSLVAAQYIERVGDDRGRVKVDTSLRVRVGSDIQPRDPMLCEVQTRLARDAEVKILGRLDGGWLKITPPDGVYVYVSADYVEQISAEVADRLRAAKAVTASAATPQPPPPATQPTEQPDLSGPWGKRLARALLRVEAQEQQPPDNQAWDAIANELRPIAGQREEPQVARLAAAWLERADRQIEQRAVAREAGEIVRQADRDRARQARELEELCRAKAELKQRPRFDARGVLRPSFVLPAGPYGLRYKLQDPFSHKVTAYVEFPTELDLDIPACVGKYVGVRGEKQKVAGVKVSILRASRLTVLNPDPPSEPAPRQKP